MNIKRLFLLLLFFFSIVLIVPKTTKAFDLKQALTSEVPIVVKIQEGIEYFFAFKIKDKVTVLEKHAEKRLVMAQNYAEGGKQEKVGSTLQDYLEIKDRQNELLDKTDSGEVLGEVAERTLDQQKTMEQIKLRVDEDGKKEIIQIQEQVVNQVAQRIVVVDGPEGKNEFFQEVKHVWAPGTGPGGTAGVVIEGGGSQYAPGTSAGGGGGVQYAGGTGPTTVITGGVETPNDTGSNTPGGFAPGTTGGAPTDVVVTDGVIKFAPGTSEYGENRLAP